jgi:hypothetical protein
VKGAVETKAVAGLGLGASFVYRIKRAEIQHSALGAAKVFWRLDGARFFQEDAPELVVIAQVPKEVSAITIDGALQAYRYFNFLSADVQEAVRHFGEALQAFFRGGLPVGHLKSWPINLHT